MKRSAWVSSGTRLVCLRLEMSLQHATSRRHSIQFNNSSVMSTLPLFLSEFRVGEGLWRKTKLTEIENMFLSKSHWHTELKREAGRRSAPFNCGLIQTRHLRSKSVNKNNHTRNWAKKTREGKLRQTQTNDNYAYDKLLLQWKETFFPSSFRIIKEMLQLKAHNIFKQ